MANINQKKNEKKVKFSIAKKPEDISFEDWQIGLRKQFSEKQKFLVKNIGIEKVFSDYEVLNTLTKKSYKVALRSTERGFNFCACPDFKINNLGTCKHIEKVITSISSKKPLRNLLNKKPVRSYSSATLRYGTERKVILRIGSTKQKEIKKLASAYFDSQLVLKKDAYPRFDKFLNEVKMLDNGFKCYDDALDFIITERERAYREKIVLKYFPNGIDSIGFKELIKLTLYDYQKEGILKAVVAGRFLIADDMGLGKTIQSIAIARIMKKLFNVEKVLIICPTSLKYQWQSEIKKITGEESLVIEGMIENRELQYEKDDFYKIVSYNTIARDTAFINKMSPDLIILDEAQRIKNWKTKTAQSVKGLHSQYCLVLTGTPLENKLEELHSIIEFVDQYKLGLLSKFLYEHQIKDNSGKVIGYSNLNKIGNTISAISIRRTKKEVLKQLPERIDKTIMVAMTPRQMDIHQENQEIVSKLVNKWKRLGFLNEKDRQFLMIALSRMRMACDSSYILDQKTRHDTKVDELRILLEEIFQNKEEKVVIFSQWERMTRLIAEELDQMKVNYEYLHGGVPAIKRKELLTNFKDQPECRVFLSTDAGGVGLNLQSASVVINMDCPWNPAVLEQRIGRVHRIGQSKPVTVINYISLDTIEERMLSLISFKKQLFEGVLDGGADSIFMGESKMKQFMKTVEELNVESKVRMMQEELVDNSFVEAKTNSSPELTLFSFDDIVDDKIQNEKLHTEKIEDNNINDLIQSGISFLNKLGTLISDKEKVKKSLTNLVHKDEKTNQTYLKIPIEGEEIINKSVGMVLNFLETIKKHGN